jgi:hypothetical protein
MQEYTVKIDGGNPITVLANNLEEAAQKAMNYNMIGDCDAIEFLSNMFNLKGNDNVQ